MNKYQVGFYVLVEVEAHNGSEAILVANSACHWPGDWRPPEDPTYTEGELNGHPVHADIIRSVALMIKEVT